MPDAGKLIKLLPSGVVFDGHKVGLEVVIVAGLDVAAIFATNTGLKLAGVEATGAVGTAVGTGRREVHDKAP